VPIAKDDAIFSELLRLTYVYPGYIIPQLVAFMTTRRPMPARLARDQPSPLRAATSPITLLPPSVGFLTQDDQTYSSKNGY